MLHLDKTILPHLGEKVIYGGPSPDKADAAMILLHGRGADAASMGSLINELSADKMIYIVPEAAD